MVILSLCIPTYNRAVYLNDTIDSIIKQDEFQNENDVEIVISDNCSSDNTKEVVDKYVKMYPAKIRYSRNETNIGDNNFEKALSMGSGVILKLNNDTLKIDNGGLKILLDVCRYCIAHNYTPFFNNRNITVTFNKCQSVENGKYISCANNAEFISSESFYCTWIGAFCICRKDFEKIHDFSSKTALGLTQVYVLMSLLSRGEKILISSEKFGTTVTPRGKGGYDLVGIFLINYFAVLAPFFEGGKNSKVLILEKKKLLYKFLIGMLISISYDRHTKTNQFTFDISKSFEKIRMEIGLREYIYFRMRYLVCALRFRLASLLKKSATNAETV
jgi:abequosyltransferase